MSNIIDVNKRSTKNDELADEKDSLVADLLKGVLDQIEHNPEPETIGNKVSVQKPDC